MKLTPIAPEVIARLQAKVEQANQTLAELVQIVPITQNIEIAVECYGVKMYLYLEAKKEMRFILAYKRRRRNTSKSYPLEDISSLEGPVQYLLWLLEEWILLLPFLLVHRAKYHDLEEKVGAFIEAHKTELVVEEL